MTGMQAWFVTSKFEEDVLELVEAPDPRVHGDRAHWRHILDVRAGDRVWFRNSGEKSVVGVGRIGNRVPDGPHTQYPSKYPQAIKWRVEDIQFLQPAIADNDFRDLFERFDDGTAGFQLFDSRGWYCQGSYLYPVCERLDQELRRHLG